ncbi:EEF1A lysine methyltransferase 2 isoform X2 [Rhipicephalus microplus]|uniref:EEF1A lysine methyltransferase 2 isoform X2 n=1 Tax=Rhipicephalus microplus TaxID=6941 RepID=UPI003F6A548C
MALSSRLSCGHVCDNSSELNPSELGTKTYWEEAYQDELSNFTNHGDVGEVWFGSKNEHRVTTWMLQHAEKASHILDIGCGNGHLLIHLAKEGFTNLTGVDFIENAVTLARKLAAKEAVVVLFEVGDILEQELPCPCFSRKYDFVLDKDPCNLLRSVEEMLLSLWCGQHDPHLVSLPNFLSDCAERTYDAISLCPDNPQEKRMHYLQVVSRILAPGGHFVIVSCNWTQEELTDHFDRELVLVDTIPTPTFSFGGSQGRSVTALVFGFKSSRIANILR